MLCLSWGELSTTAVAVNNDTEVDAVRRVDYSAGDVRV